MTLKDWLYRQGRTIRWLAQETEIPITILYPYNQGIRSLHDEYIDRIVALTNGECTYEELKRKAKIAVGKRR